MSWTRKYWDAVDDFYWTPSYLGLKSIPQKHWETCNDTVTIPKELTNPRGPLYRRLRSGDDYWNYVRRQEETFNHIFNITFSVLPGDVVSGIFSQFIGADCGHHYDSLGLGQKSRYEWNRQDNITTADGFFVADDSLLAVELKFNAKTSLNQLAKYLVLFVCEEQLTGKRPHIDLLYIFNGNSEEKFLKQTGFSCDRIGACKIDDLKRRTSQFCATGFLRRKPQPYRIAAHTHRSTLY